MNILWLLGDSQLSSEAAALVTAKSLTFVDTSKPDAIFEDIWADQVFAPEVRNREIKEIVVIIFINNNDYDSEGTIARVLSRSSKIKRIIYLFPANPSDNLLDGFSHFDFPIQRAVIGTTTLEAMYES